MSDQPQNVVHARGARRPSRRPLTRIVLRSWLSRPLRTFLAIGGIALGVAVLMAVRLANYSAVEAFVRTLEMVAGRADIEVLPVGGGDIPPDLYRPFTLMDEVEAAAPVAILRGTVGEEGRGVQLLGVDMARDSKMRPWYSAELSGGEDPLAVFTTPNGVLMTPAMAEELGLAPGDRFPFTYAGETHKLQVLGLLRGEEVARARTRDIMVMDLPRAWAIRGGPPTLQRIDLLLDEHVNPDRAAEAIRDMLPPGVRAEVSGWRRNQAQRMLASFRMNLTALAFVALLVAGFLVYQTVNTTALERRRMAGILRAVGASRDFVRRVFLAEGLGLGFVGALAGIPLGLALSRAAVKAVTRSVESIYVMESTGQLYLSWEIVATSFLLGLVVSVVAVAPVAREASRVPPRESLARQVLEDRMRPRMLALAGLAFLAVGGALTNWPVPGVPVISGYAAAACFVFGVALATPWLLGVVHTIVSAAAGRWFGAEGRLALGVLVRSRHRISPAVAALATAVAMWLSVDMMVRSFRDTVDTWVHSTITADLIVTSGGSVSVGKRTLMPMESFERLKRVDAFADVDFFRSERVEIGGRLTSVAMVDMESVRRQDRLKYVQRRSEGHPTDPLIAGRQAAIVSEPLAFRMDLGVGDTLRFKGPRGPEALRVSAVFYDYSSDAGMVLVSRDWFAQRWDDREIESAAVYLPPTMSLSRGRSLIRDALPREMEADIFSNRELRDAVLEVFDSTFAITYALEAVAIMVALLAVGGGMASLVAERVRELAILRAIGGSRTQLMRRVLGESGIIGAMGWLLGAALGVVLSMVLTYVVNLYSFGWSLNLKLPWTQFAVSGVLMIAAALLAGALPAWKAARLRIAHGVRVDTE